MFRSIPTWTILINRDDPPYDKKGSVTPVTGINPITTDKFSILWIIIWNVIPNDKYFANESICLLDIFIPRYRIIMKRNTTS